MKTYDTITDLIGSTPLLKLNRFAAAENLGAEVYAKLEYFNPAGSVKDRIAYAMIDRRREAAVRSSPAPSSSSRPAATPASALPPSPPREATASSSSCLRP